MATDDDAQLHALFARMRRAWSDGDARAYGDCFTADVDYVGFDGLHVRGRDETAARHDRLFRGVLSGSALVGELAAIRYLHPDVAVVHGTGSVLMPWRSRLPKGRRSYQTMVAIRGPDGWRFAAFHNSRLRPVRIPGPDAVPSRASRALSRLAGPRRRHVEDAAPHQLPAGAGPPAVDDPAAGFTLTRVLPCDPDRLFAHFVEPEAFSRWFVVDGYSTPAERVSLDARPGGTISAVLVPAGAGPEIPLAAAYGTVDPPRTVQLAFTEPTELVTITLVDLGDAGTQLTYRNQGGPLRERAQALAGVARMLDALEASVAATGP